MLQEALARALDAHPEVLLAILFGSHARGTAHAHSDVDLAVAFSEPPDALALGRLVADLERAVRADVDLVDLGSVSPVIAHRAFRDGVVVVDRDHARSTALRTRLELGWLDFAPAHRRLVDGVLRRLADGR